MIEVRNLTKKYGDHLAVNDLSFTIENGKIYGLLGPNGAGKSTTMNIITGCLAATSGTVLIDGHDIFEEPIEAKRHIGYLPEQPPLYTDMTAAEYLDFVARAKGMPYDAALRQEKEVMQLTGIEPVKDRLLKNLSKGYRQRVGIAQVMLGDPDVIILDEPTVGLDPKQIIEIRDLIKKLGSIKTVILSSHILAEISAVCDHVMIISHGRLVADDSIEDLENSVNSANDLSLKVRGSAVDVKRILAGVGGIVSAEYSEKDGVTSAALKTEKSLDIRDDIFFAFAAARLPVIEMVYRVLTLEDIFLALTDDGDAPHDDGTEQHADTGRRRPHLFARAGKEEEENSDDDYTPQFGSVGGEEENDK